MGPNPAILPKVVELDFSTNHFGGSSNTPTGLFTSHTGKVKLYISDNRKGVYAGILTITQLLNPSNISDIEFSYLEIAGSLGEGVAVSGNHYFQVGYSANIQGSKTICDDPLEAAMQLSINPNNSCNSLNIFTDNSPFSGYKWVGGETGFVEIDGYTTTTVGDKFLHAYIDKCMHEALAPDDEIEERFSDSNPQEQENMHQAFLSVSPNPFTNDVLISYKITEEMHGKEVTFIDFIDKWGIGQNLEG